MIFHTYVNVYQRVMGGIIRIYPWWMFEKCKNMEHGKLSRRCSLIWRFLFRDNETIIEARLKQTHNRQTGKNHLAWTKPSRLEVLIYPPVNYHRYIDKNTVSRDWPTMWNNVEHCHLPQLCQITRWYPLTQLLQMAIYRGFFLLKMVSFHSMVHGLVGSESLR